MEIEQKGGRTYRKRLRFPDCKIDETGRTCSRCGIWKPRSDYTFDKARLGGMRSNCKLCETPDPPRKRKMERAKCTLYTQRYRAKHPEKFREYQKQWREKNKERSRVKQKEWINANREKVRLYVRMSNARRRSNGLRNPVQIVAGLMALQRSRCAICRASIKAKHHIDHIMPLALGGENLPRNLQLLCVPCNLAKRAAHPIDYMQSLGMLI